MKNIIIVFFAICFYQALCNELNIGIDPTDKDGWNKSGLSYYKDYGTGKEYIAKPYSGCLIERGK